MDQFFDRHGGFGCAGDDAVAVRTVARANGTNRVCILIPCHRVIAKDGALSGYGGVVWRKRLLLDLDKKCSVLSLKAPGQ